MTDDARVRQQQLLTSIWGFETLRPHQSGPVEALVAGTDVLAIIPTGGGKSLIYQLAGLTRGGLTLVVSPLIALMEDQVQGLVRMGIRAISLGGTANMHELERLLDAIERAPASFVFVSPERLLHPLIKVRMAKWDVRTIAIDEAHCISEWGHDFRPPYRTIRKALQGFPNAVWGAFTGTATVRVMDDIQVNLGMPDAVTFRNSPFRSNLHYGICHVRDSDSMLLNSAHHAAGSGIIYVPTRHEAEKWAWRLRNVPGGAAAYHAGLPSSMRKARQHDWIQGHLRVMVCTSAFGMGIDKPNVRWVFHAFMPENLEAYVQESGRAGRDGEESTCLMFLDEAKILESKERLDRKRPDLSRFRSLYQHLANQGSVSVGDQPDQPTPVRLHTWAQAHEISPSAARDTLNLLKLSGYLSDWVEVKSTAVIVSCIPEMVDQIKRSRTPVSTLLSELWRGIPLTLTSEMWEIKGLSLDAAVVELDRFQSWGWLTYELAQQELLVSWARPREQTSHVFIPSNLGEDRYHKQVARWTAMEHFVRNQACRQQAIVRYFGFEHLAECGVCDNCQKNSGLTKHYLTEIPPEGREWSQWVQSIPPKAISNFLEVMKAAHETGEIMVTNGIVHRKT